MTNRKQLLFFTNQLAMLLEAGISLTDALIMMRTSSKKKDLAYLDKLIKLLQQGKNLSESLSLASPFFDQYYCGLIAVGERTGRLASILSNLSISLENQLNLQAKIQKALTYPLAVISIAIIVLLGMLTWVIPTFENVFIQLNADLPIPTQIILSISRYVSNYFLWWIGAFVCMGLSFVILWHQSISFQRFVDKTIIHIPFLRHFLRLNHIAKWCATVTMLQDSGVPLLETIRLTASCCNHWFIHDVCVNTYHQLSKGQTIHQSLRITDPKNILFDKTSLQMIHIGESSGKLSNMLQFLETQKEKELDQAIEKLMELLEPALITILGLLIGSMLIALYLPLFKIGEIT